MEQTSGVKLFRWIVFLLGAFYFIHAFTNFVPDKIGWQFRHLTNWAMSMSVLSAFFMLRRSTGKDQNRHEVWASTTVIMNIMVVFLYWKIYLTDPTAFYVDGVATSPFWVEYYLHLMGPILQWIDAFFILGVFRPIRKILKMTVCVNLLYIIWVETVVRPFNSEPIGTVTSGLPYRFLNNLEFSDRLMFYLQNVIVAVVLVFVFWGLTQKMRKLKIFHA